MAETVEDIEDFITDLNGKVMIYMEMSITGNAKKPKYSLSVPIAN